MKIHKDLENFIKPKKSIVTTGTFDGVHKGHAQIINQLCSKKEDEESILITFSPHPRMVLYPDQDLKLINTFEEKIELFTKYDIDHLIIQKFDYKFSRMKPLEYIRDFIIKKIGLQKLIVGYDHHFGRNRESSVEVIKEYAEMYNFDIVQIPPFKDGGISISSTKIRNYLDGGQVELVNKLLGYKFNFIGRVVKGRGIGTSIGFPTANIEIDNKNKVMPSLGVYVVSVYLEKIKYLGMLNIGKNPTFGEKNPITIELNILNFNQNIYDKKVQVTFLSKLRNEMKFQSKNDLITQLKKDELWVKNYFK